MTSNEIAVRGEPTDSWIDVLGPVAKLADYIARTAFVPKAMQGNAPAVAATVLTGRELGMGPMTSLRSLEVIEGSVQMKTKATLARIYQAGHRVEWLEVSDKACEVRIERGDGLSTGQVRWTLADAQRAGLAGKGSWAKYPRAMLRNRALSECAELTCPDVILGLEVGEDVADVQRAPVQQTTTVQVARLAAQDAPGAPEPVEAAPAPTPAVEEPHEAVLVDPQPEPERSPDDLVTQAQMRKIGALIGEWERVEGRALDRAERRRFIGFMAGVTDPDSLASAKDLTKDQASEAIDQLQAAIDAQTPEETSTDG